VRKYSAGQDWVDVNLERVRGLERKRKRHGFLPGGPTEGQERGTVKKSEDGQVVEVVESDMEKKKKTFGGGLWCEQSHRARGEKSSETGWPPSLQAGRKKT